MQGLNELMGKYEDVLVIIGAIVVSLQGLVAGLITIAKLLGKLALMTQTKADDDALARVSLWLGKAHDKINWLQRFLPRARLGKEKEPLVGTSIRPPPPADSPPGAAPPDTPPPA